jgi:hypothetical protein
MKTVGPGSSISIATCYGLDFKYHLYVMYSLNETHHVSCSCCPYFTTFLYKFKTVLRKKAFSGDKFPSENKLNPLETKRRNSRESV